MGPCLTLMVATVATDAQCHALMEGHRYLAVGTKQFDSLNHIP